MSCALALSIKSQADTEISPREAHDAPKDVLQTHVLSSSLGVFTDINGHSLGNFVSVLSLHPGLN